MLYAKVVDGNVVEVKNIRGGGYVFDDGTSTGSIQQVSEGYLNEKGLYRVVDRKVPTSKGEKYGAEIYTVVGSEVLIDREILDKSPEENLQEWERALFRVRSVRNDLLHFSDWTQNADSPLTPEKIVEWAEYRQLLRDLPTTISEGDDPDLTTYPTPPVNESSTIPLVGEVEPIPDPVSPFPQT